MSSPPGTPALPCTTALTPAPAPAASALPVALVQAYRHALYEVVLPTHTTACTLQVDVPSPSLLQAMRHRGASQACVLTACNPLGQLHTPMDNEAHMRALRLALQQEGWTWSPAFGRDPHNQWPGEDSLLVWHMDSASARAWGQRWAQNAVLSIGADATPRLELLR